MLSARAVEPERLGSIGDVDHEGHLCSTLLAGDETGPEAILHRLARLSEGGLGDRMALGPELEGDGVAFGSLDVIGFESQGTIADNDKVINSDSRAGEGGCGSKNGEAHYDWMVRGERLARLGNSVKLGARGLGKKGIEIVRRGTVGMENEVLGLPEGRKAQPEGI